MPFGVDIALILLLLCAYLVGGIPSGYLFARFFFGIDVTTCGSKNIGATNVARVLGSKKYFFLIFFSDFFKTAGYLVLARRVLLPAMGYDSRASTLLLVALVLLLGNAYSPFLGFRGGKGVATSFGILCTLFSAYISSVFFGTWLLVFLLTWRVDVASLTASTCISLGVLLGFFEVRGVELVFLLFLTLFLFMRHWANVRNLWQLMQQPSQKN